MTVTATAGGASGAIGARPAALGAHIRGNTVRTLSEKPRVDQMNEGAGGRIAVVCDTGRSAQHDRGESMNEYPLCPSRTTTPSGRGRRGTWLNVGPVSRDDGAGEGAAEPPGPADQAEEDQPTGEEEGGQGGGSPGTAAQWGARGAGGGGGAGWRSWGSR